MHVATLGHVIAGEEMLDTFVAYLIHLHYIGKTEIGQVDEYITLLQHPLYSGSPISFKAGYLYDPADWSA
jgi:hypothetical protein